MSRLFITLFGLVCCAGSLRAQAGEPFRFPEGRHGTGELKYVNKIPVLTVSGTPEEIGEAVGVLALKPGARVLEYPREVMDAYYAGVFWNIIVSQGRDMVKQFPADHLAEMEAMTKASGASRDKVIAGNTMFDIKKIVLCSALMVESDRSATGGPPGTQPRLPLAGLRPRLQPGDRLPAEGEARLRVAGLPGTGRQPVGHE